jgi:asparagine synthase (glutamine-hydrolysing)
MFAIALWDEDRRKLLLVRDRLGVKPLYYYADGDRTVLGSELKAILEAGIPREIDEDALAQVLALQYIPAPRTIFRGVHKLPPGHLLRAEAGGVKVDAYWTVPEESIPAPRPEAELREELRELLADAVKIRLIADVPLAYSSSCVDRAPSSP